MTDPHDDVPATARAMNAAVLTIDFSCPDGALIQNIAVANPAFAVIPHLIAGIITEHGLARPGDPGRLES